MKDLLIVGVDFGSQLAGTTVICREVVDRLALFSSEKGKSSDQFLLDHFTALPPCHIGLDAPLSLPGVYQKLKSFSDYQYRISDRELNAMSPMFLGGLTARAMRLKSELEKLGHSVIEVYPAALLKHFGITSAYKKVKDECLGTFTQISHVSGVVPPSDVSTSHDVDSFLAYISARRSVLGEGIVYGDSREGQITV